MGCPRDMEAYVGVLYSGDLTYSQAMLMDKNKHAGITQYRRIDLLWGGGDYGHGRSHCSSRDLPRLVELVGTNGR